MRFTGDKVAFGRHETFALRFWWLTKGAKALMSGEPVFEAEDAAVQLGVGKNMVSWFRYWLQAARIIVKGNDGWELTETGAYIFALRETAGIHQLHLLREVEPTELLDYHYQDAYEEAAA